MAEPTPPPSKSAPASAPESPSPAASRRAEANRLNAQKSTGPRTSTGKARSSLNAVTHGLTSQASLLPGEDPAELEALGTSMLRHLKPSNPLQRVLAERVVALTWKLRRAATAEEAAARRIEGRRQNDWERRNWEAQHSPYGPPPGERPAVADAGRLLAESFRETGADRATAVDGPLVRITRYELKLDAALRGAVRELRALQKEEPSRAPADEPARPAPEAPEPERASEPARATTFHPAEAPDGGTNGRAMAPSARDEAPGENEPNPVAPAKGSQPPPASGP